MPVVKKIVSLDVQSNLQEFTKEFDRYNEVLSKQPEMWADVAKENEAMAKGFKAMAALMLAQQHMARDIANENKKVEQHSSKAALYWDSMARSSKTIAGNIVAATRSLEKWTGIFSLTSGLALGGSVWGFERLAAGAGAGRREATGLGLSYGAKRAFDLTYGRFADTSGIVRGVSSAQGDLGSQEARAMYALGMVPGQHGDTAEESVEVLKRVRALAQSSDPKTWGRVIQGRGLGALGVDIETMRRLSTASDADLDAEGYKKRMADFGVSDKALKDMQEFDMALEGAGIKIKSTFIEALSPLAPELKQLADGLSDAVKQLIGGQGFKDGVHWVAEGLHEFGQYVNKPAFKQDIKDLADGISYAAKKMVSWARWLGLLPESEEEKRKNAAIADATHGSMKNDHNSTSSSFGKGGKTNPLSPSNGGVKYLPDGTPIVDTPPAGSTMSGSAAGSDMLDLVRRLEGTPDGRMSPAGAVGVYQIMPETARGLGYDPDDRYDPVKNKEMAQKLLSQLDQKYHGNKAEILADYNGGPAAVDIYRRGGLAGLDNWTNRSGDHPYRETANYLRNSGVEVTINNNTGGSAVTSIANAGGVSGVGTPGPSILQ